MPQNSVITQFAAAFPGMNGDSSDSTDNYISRTSAEAANQLPFGTLVMQGTTDDACVALTTQTAQKILGVVAYQATYAPGIQLGTAVDANGNLGVMPKASLLIKKRGTAWVQIDENVTPTSAVRVRVNAVGSGVGPGCFRASASVGNTVALSSFCKWQGTYLATSKAGLLSFDFTMSALGTND